MSNSQQPVAGVDVAALKERAVIVKDTSIAALRDEAREFGRMPFKVRDMHVGALHDTIRDLLAALDALTRAQAEQQGEIAKLTRMLADCYRESGADPDGNEDWRLAPLAVAAVREARADADAEAEKADREVSSLRQAIRQAEQERDEAQGHVRRLADALAGRKER